MSPRLPETYAQRMEALLGAEYPAFLASFDRKVFSGMRVNTLKLPVEAFQSLWGRPCRQIPWCPEGIYAEESWNASRHPFYYAGLYYLQEPSAMAPASVLPVRPGDRVLDLCAAPGGKSTQLLCKLQGEGLLVSNDISPSRAKALLKNLELFGGKNYIVTTEAPFRLAEQFPGFFNKILIDAPCSGEGMFHKEPSIMRNWEQYGNAYYADLQREILEYAVRMLMPGGQMVYSTCTFAPLEDEQSLQDLLDAHPEMHLVPIEESSIPDHGCPDWIPDGDPQLAEALRLWPHRIDGEGHFVALLEKEGVQELDPLPKVPSVRCEPLDLWCRENLRTDLADLLPRGGHLRQIGDFLVWDPLPETFTKGIRVLRSGLLLGECRRDRFEPSQALAMALRMTDVRCTLDLPAADDRVLRYLKGETLNGEFGKSWYLVGTEGCPLGWARGSGSLLKNKYLKGWRYL